MSLTHRAAPTPPPAHEPPHHVLVARPPTPPPDPDVPTRQREWGHMHLVLAAWKARSLLVEALHDLRDALDTTPCVEDGCADELRAAVTAMEETVARLRTITASGPAYPAHPVDAEPPTAPAG